MVRATRPMMDESLRSDGMPPMEHERMRDNDAMNHRQAVPFDQDCVGGKLSHSLQGRLMKIPRT